MKNKLLNMRVFSAALLAVELTGCATPGQYLDETKSVDVAGAYQLADRESFETIDLGNLICQYAPQGDVNKCNTGDDSVKLKGLETNSNNPQVTTEKKTLKPVDAALHYYNEHIQLVGIKQQAASRNALQERLLAASSQRCNAYKGNLQRTFSRTNFGLGILSTIAGTAGAVVNSAAAASTWAGVSAISSGTRAEFNQDYMSNLAAYVIVDGIDKRRQVIYEQIQTRGQAKSYEAYPVEAAIKDALYYHGQCSVIAGFQEASDSIKTSKDPGMNAAITAMAKIQAANLMMHGSTQTPESLLEAAKKITETTGPTQIAGSNLKPELTPEASLDDFLAIVTEIQSVNATLKATVDEFTTAANAGILKDSLKRLGLEKPPVFAQQITEADRKACVQKMADYSRDEYLARAESEVVQEVASKEEQRATADLNHARKGKIIASGQKLAENFKQQANAMIADWQISFEQAKDAGIDKMEVFRTKLVKRLELDKTLGDKLSILCTPGTQAIPKK